MRSIQEQIEKERTEHQLHLQREKSTLQNELKEQSQNQELSFREERLKIENTQLKTEQRREVVAQKEQLLENRKRSQNEWERELESQIENRVSSKIVSLESQLSQERANRKNDQDEIAKIQKQLINFKDLERSLDNANIEDIQFELNSLKQENKDLKTKLYTSDEDLDEKCDILEEKVSDQRDEISEIRQELEEANAELHKRNLSTATKHNLEKEKRILELHNRTLDSAIEGLQTQLDDLVDKQQGSKVFPALSKMDQTYKNDATNLQPVPNLKSFADQLRWEWRALILKLLSTTVKKMCVCSWQDWP